jgi:hypothetical protein
MLRFLSQLLYWNKLLISRLGLFGEAVGSASRRSRAQAVQPAEQVIPDTDEEEEDEVVEDRELWV